MLSACGGGGSSDPSSSGFQPVGGSGIALSGLMGQITALAPGVLQTGTFPLSFCSDAVSGLPVNRKLRLGTDGSVALLDADNNDTVLTNITVDQAAQVIRNLSVDNSGSRNIWRFSIGAYSAGNTIQASDIDFELGNTFANIQIRNATTGAVTGGVSCRDTANGGAVVSISVTLTESAVAQRLASAVALNNSGAVTGSSGSDSVSFSTQGVITTAIGQSAASPWVSGWLSTGSYTEAYNSTTPADPVTNNAGTPANPSVAVSVYGSGSNQGPVSMRRNTASNNGSTGQAVTATVGRSLQ